MAWCSTRDSVWMQSMIRVKLREAMDQYGRRTGQRLTYDDLARVTGLSPNTIQSLATRESYNASLAVIDKICVALRCQIGDILEHTHDDQQTG